MRQKRNQETETPVANGTHRVSWPKVWADSPAQTAESEATATPTQPAAPVEPAAVAAAAAVTPRDAGPRTAGPFEAFVRHPILTLLPVLLLAGAALYVGLARDPIYTAKARINVGRSNVPPYVLQNVIGGSQTLAASYARVISTDDVVRQAARGAGVSPATAQRDLSASPIPGSTLIQVEATGPDRRAAVTLSNEGARSLIQYVKKITSDNVAKAALRRYRKAQARVGRLQTRLINLRGPGRKRALAYARTLVDFEAAKLQASNLAGLYRASTTDVAGGSPVRLIAPAASASSDFRTMLERLILIGVLGGLVVGLALALLRANRGRIRAIRE